MRAAPVLSIVALVLLAALVPPAAGVAPRASACQKRKAKHRDLSPNRKLVLTLRDDGESGRISACVLPRGKVRRLAEWDDGLSRASGGIAGTKGTFVLITESWGDQYGGVAHDLYRADGRTGKRVTLAGYACQIQGPMSCTSGTDYGAYVLAANGAGAIERTDLATGETTLQSFDPAGAFAQLDAGPVQSLAIVAGEIVWTRDGVEHRAPLPR